MFLPAGENYYKTGSKPMGADLKWDETQPWYAAHYSGSGIKAGTGKQGIKQGINQVNVQK